MVLHSLGLFDLLQRGVRELFSIYYNYRVGSERDTTGILMWSEVFPFKSKGKDVVVAIMDTQVGTTFYFVAFV
jgi:proteasome assembly chaperone (PAC2) family protein